MKKQLIGLIICLLILSSLNAQNVGIGAPSPSEKLEVNGGIRVGYTNSSFSGGTLRFNGVNAEMEYNTGFVWRSLVNSFKDSSLSLFTPFTSSTRNSYQSVPGAKMTVTEAGTYLIIYKINGSNNNVYFPSSGNSDIIGTADFLLNGGTVARRNFILPENTFDGATARRDFQSNPVEYSTVQSLTAGSIMTIMARMDAVGTVGGSWTVNEAQITTIRLY